MDGGADTAKWPCDLANSFKKHDVPGISTLTWATIGSATLSPSEKEIYFNGAEDGGISKLYIATRNDPGDEFTGIREVPNINAPPLSDWNPGLSPDRFKLVFSRQNVLDGGKPDLTSSELFIVSRPNATQNFANVRALDNVNSARADQHPFISADGGELWFSSYRLDQNLPHLFRAIASGEDFVDAQLVESPNETSFRQEAPVLSADGKSLFYSGNGNGALDENDIWEAYRDTENGPFHVIGRVVELSAGGGSGKRDYPSWISPDGCRLYAHTTNAAGKETIMVGVRSP